MHHGLQHYSECLKNNGYDDPQFLADVSDKELLEIGIVQAPDREKVSLTSTGVNGRGHNLSVG